MTLQEFERVVSTARPGSRLRLITLEVEVAGAAVGVGEGPPVAPDAANSMPALGGGGSGGLTDRLMTYRLGHPEARLTPGEWSRAVRGISERELDRALKRGALVAEPRGEGKGHAAKVIRVGALLTYLSLCEAVQAGREAVPEWWDKVRMGPAADIEGREVRDAA